MFLVFRIDHAYKQPSVPTTILVMKAVGSHLVLTFCRDGLPSYSITLSREQYLLSERVSVAQFLDL